MFECQVDENKYAELVRCLLAEFDDNEDSLLFYRITEPSRLRVKEYGKFKAKDFEAPLVV